VGLTHWIPPPTTYQVLSVFRVLTTLITTKFVHRKFIQKYEWAEHTGIYHHAKFEVKTKICARRNKKEKLALE